MPQRSLLRLAFGPLNVTPLSWSKGKKTLKGRPVILLKQVPARDPVGLAFSVFHRRRAQRHMRVPHSIVEAHERVSGGERVHTEDVKTSEHAHFGLEPTA